MEAGLGSQKSPSKKRKRTLSEKAAASAEQYGVPPAGFAPPRPQPLAANGAPLVAQPGAQHQPARPPTSAHARRLVLQSAGSPVPSAGVGGGGGGSAQRAAHATPHGSAPRAAAGLGDTADTPLRLDFDVDNPLEFFLSQGVPEALAVAALAACGNCPDRAQVWIMTHGSSAAAARSRPSGGAAGHAGAAAAARAAAGGHAAAADSDDDSEAAEAAFQRDLERAQLASEALSKEEERMREATFVACARADPIETFEDTSVFLAVARGRGGPPGALTAPGGATLSDDELRALLDPLAEFLLLERQALKHYAAHVVPYFRRQAALLAAAPGGTAARAKMLRERVAEVGDPSRAGSMNGMPPPGRSGGLPAVFDGDEDGALCISDSDVVVLD